MPAIEAAPRNPELQLLMVEDSEVDALLLIRRLKTDQYEVQWERVETAGAMREALRNKRPDIIICDYNLPRFSAQEALQVLEETGLDIPFLVVSGTVGEESAVDMMKAGAHDIILKHNLSRLMPAIERERAQAKLRHDHRRMQAEIQENATRFRHLAESTRVIAATFDVEAQLWTYIGPQITEILGFAPSKWSEPDFWIEHVHADDREQIREAHRARQQEGKNSETEYRMVAADGRTLWIRDMFRVVSHPDGRRVGYALAFDITEAKQRDQQLAQAQKLDAVGKLTGGIAHDFNNLLAIIHGNAEFLRERVTDPDNIEFADEVLGAAGRGADLVRRLLAFCRQQDLRTEAVDLTKRLPEVIGLLRRTLGERIEVKTASEPDLWLALVDPTQVDDALVNLAINARDAMPEGGTLTIEMANVALDEDYANRHSEVRAGDYVMLAVSDTGTGMPPAVVARACEPFFTTKPIDRGTGLGLSQIYGWTKQSGGHLNIYSEVGKGTTIKLYLPRAKDAAAAAPVRSVEGPPVGSETVLIVEDNSEVRRVAVRQLKELGYHVMEARDAEEALEMVDRGINFELLFSDVIMPGKLTGYDLARAIRKRMPGAKILFASGYTALTAQDGSGGLGLGPLITKPYSKRDLAHFVRNVLDGVGS
jgi:two-component system, cell cycle sensor histidine kinase and response regulator CckA